MSKHWLRDLDRLQHDLLALAGLVEGAIRKSVQALRHRDTALARQVIEGDNQVDREESQIEEECLKMLALHQPVASDLRKVAAAKMINVDLERMGDLAEEIAERALHIARLPSVQIPDKLFRMAELSIRMVAESIDAFVNLDAKQARLCWRLDDDVDRFHRELIAAFIALMRANPAQVEAGLSLFSVTEHLERIADHATNVAEDVLYLVEGEIVRHRPAAVVRDEGVA